MRTKKKVIDPIESILFDPSPINEELVTKTILAHNKSLTLESAAEVKRMAMAKVKRELGEGWLDNIKGAVQGAKDGYRMGGIGGAASGASAGVRGAQNNAEAERNDKILGQQLYDSWAKTCRDLPPGTIPPDTPATHNDHVSKYKEQIDKFFQSAYHKPTLVITGLQLTDKPGPDGKITAPSVLNYITQALRQARSAADTPIPPPPPPPPAAGPTWHASGGTSPSPMTIVGELTFNGGKKYSLRANGKWIENGGGPVVNADSIKKLNDFVHAYNVEKDFI